MPRQLGVKNRKDGNSVKELKERLEDYRQTRIRSEGCKWGEHCDEGRLAFFHGPNEIHLFSPSRAPYIQGMTWEKMEAELSKCILLCRRHQKAINHF